MYPICYNDWLYYSDYTVCCYVHMYHNVVTYITVHLCMYPLYDCMY